MEGQRQNASGSRRRKHRSGARNPATPVLIAARRPDSPVLPYAKHKGVAASAEPSRGEDREPSPLERRAKNKAALEGPPRRAARIVQAQVAAVDDQEQLRQRLLFRLQNSEGRHAISKIADELWAQNFSAPEEQEFQLQLLEHFDEARVRSAMGVIERLLRSEPPIKRPILDQRLRRLEEYAEDAETRDQARQLRRTIRS